MAIRAAHLTVDVDADTDKAEHGLHRLTERVGGIGSAIAKTSAIAIAGGATLAIGFAGKAIMAASDLNETLSKTQVVFGNATKIVTDDAKRMADAFGIPKTQFLDAAGSIGLIGKAAGLSQAAAATMSARMADLAADASSFYNVPLEDALAAMHSGLVGEAEPLRRFGVLLNETAVGAEAVRLGIAKQGATLTEAQKVQARASLIMRGMKDASGDLERTQSSLANRLRELKGRAENFAATFGSVLLPIVLRAFDVFDSLQKPMREIAHLLGGVFTDAWHAAFSGFDEGTSDLTGLAGIFQTLGRFAWTLVQAIRSVWGVFADGTDIAQGLGESLDAAFGNTGRYVGVIRDAVSMVIEVGSALRQSISEAIPFVERLYGEYLVGLRDVLTQVITEVISFATQVRAAFMAGPVHDGLVKLWTSLRGFVKTVQESVARVGGLGNVLKVVGAAVLAITNPWLVLAGALIYAYTHFEIVRTVINAVLGFILGEVLPGVIRFAGVIIEAFSRVVNWFQVYWPLISEAVARVMETLEAIIRPALDVLVPIFTFAFQAIAAVVTLAWRVIGAVVKAAVGVLSGVIRLALALISGDWGAAWDAIKSIFVSVWTAIKSIFGAALSFLGTILKDAVVGIVHTFEGLGSAIASVFTSMWGTAKRVSGDFVGFIIGKVVRPVVDAFLGFAEGIVGAADAAFGWVPGLGGKLDKAKDSVASFRDETNAMLSGLADSAYGWGEDVGGNIGKGVTSGIHAQIGAVATESRRMANAAHAAAAKELQVSSPSKRFARLGAFSAQGYAGGIAAQAFAAANAAARMANGAARAARERMTALPVALTRQAVLAGAGGVLTASGALSQSHSSTTFVDARTVVQGSIFGEDEWTEKMRGRMADTGRRNGTVFGRFG